MLLLSPAVVSDSCATLWAVWASLVAQTIKNLPATREAWLWSQGWEDPLEEEMAPHSSTVVWKIPWSEEPGGLQSWGRKEWDKNE